MTVRCAVYTRKSTEEGLEQDFNSLDAQREAAEAYIASQRAEGWTALDTRYDDGGYSGGNVDRPAFQRLLADVRDGRVDAIVVYKIDRLSRSLMDFARIMEELDRRGVALCSITQQFNTTTSMGRLTLNILLSFAQFEREIISERTRDKVAAMRRKGKLWGGRPVLGYDVARPPESPGGSKLVINEEEADRVRRLFELYLEHGAMMPVVEEAARLGWTTKRWTTRAGKQRGGGPIDKGRLWRILTNVTYIGKVSFEGEVYDGEQDAIVPTDLWQHVQAKLAGNGHAGGHTPGPRSANGARSDEALLRGLLVCKACACSMSPTYTARRTADGVQKRYRYYVCHRATKQGRRRCPSPSLPAGEIERFVVDEIAAVGRDPAIREQVLVRAEAQLAANGNGRGRPSLDRDGAVAALAEFEPLWQALSPGEQRCLIQLLVERVVFDAANGRVSITFRPTGIATLGATDDEVTEDEATEPVVEEIAA